MSLQQCLFTPAWTWTVGNMKVTDLFVSNVFVLSESQGSLVVANDGFISEVKFLGLEVS